MQFSVHPLSLIFSHMYQLGLLHFDQQILRRPFLSNFLVSFPPVVTFLFLGSLGFNLEVFFSLQLLVMICVITFPLIADSDR